jgi:uncharacterized protein YbjT (DUF2867 family)
MSKSSDATTAARCIALTGATGYVGGRLLGRLEDRRSTVRCLTRRPDDLRPRVQTGTQVVYADVLDPPSLVDALADVDVAFYLVHALGSGEDLYATELRGATDFAEAAAKAGVRRIIYLGGLGHGEQLSDHLRSRHDVGKALAGSGVPTLEFRASIIIGSGSASFEMIRSLVRKLPIMIIPRWTRRLAQPIGIEDVIDYLLAAIDCPLPHSRVVEIGGPDQVTYLDLMREYAQQRGVKRYFIPVPVLTPYLSSLWLGLVTPLYARIGRQLIESIQHDTVVTDRESASMFDIRPRGVRQAMARALSMEDQQFARTRWSDAISSLGPTPSYGGQRLGSRLVDSRSRPADAPASRAFAAIRRIGGKRGWYFANWLWRLRGWMDVMLGGPGMQRGRRSAEHLLPGDTLDCWRVEAIEPDHLLRLRAEMKLPGRAWLQFEIEPADSPDRCVIRQTALFDPVGLTGLMYWYGVWPLHAMVFSGMLRGLVRRAEQPEAP